MEITHCHVITKGIIDDPCRLQFSALDEKELGALLQDHLRTMHKDEFEGFGSQDLQELENRIIAKFEE